MRVCVIGGGFAGVGTASVLQRRGIECVIYEREAAAGGVWLHAYPSAACQNIATDYYLPCFTWEQADIRPSFYPTKAQLLDYLRAAVKQLKLDVRLNCNVASCRRASGDGQPTASPSNPPQVREGQWIVLGRGPGGEFEEKFDYLLVATGLFWTPRPTVFPDQDKYTGRILSDNDLTPEVLKTLQGKTLAVVGFGKSALDQATDAADSSGDVRTLHLFRRAEWALPHRVCGVHYTWLLLSCAATLWIPCWDHPTAAARALHARARWLVRAFWSLASALVWASIASAAWGRGRAARARIAALRPFNRFIECWRLSLPLIPERYLGYVAGGAIEPVRGDIARFCPEGLRLTDGRTIVADAVGLCIGHSPPTFPFLPEEDRGWLEGMQGGVQLYRHVVHPRVPGIGFVGFNTGYLNLSQVEIGALWLSAVMLRELVLPPARAQEAAIESMRAWKAAHEQPCPATNCCVIAHFAQYNDVLLGDLGVRALRGAWLSRRFRRMVISDYADVVDEYEAQLRRRGAGAGPRHVLLRIM